MEYRAIAINQFVTARQTGSGRVLLFTPSDMPEGAYVPSSEIYLSRNEIARLAQWADAVPVQEENRE